MNTTIDVHIYPDEMSIKEKNHKGKFYPICDGGCTLDTIVQAFSDYIYTYLSGYDDNV